MVSQGLLFKIGRKDPEHNLFKNVSKRDQHETYHLNVGIGNFTYLLIYDAAGIIITN